ncbi:MobF family relaxase [Bradyrhizobium sp. cf659]|uniref:MobF family relaxase n=1 Tax=Bradyrhizobium sp. cf659 TaxID=1761771 RepID=UPI0008DEE0A8|nr:MobF family relaxase [Bradyrhizobium sp. cf659]SFJ53637.1 conjugative relaxase domain-containing protein, TrwC/TraI family [Bradyrhizobium sp. cf659]
MTVSLHVLGCGPSAGSYYTDDPNREAKPRARDEYYASEGKGHWWSTGESLVRNGAPIERSTFRDLCSGIDPRNGAALVRGAGARHRAGWDLTFSAPKSFSLLWAAGTPEQRERLEQIQREAVHQALQFLVRERLVYVRLGAGGCRREQPTDIIVGLFEHFTSREGDPACHVHAVLLNLARSADRKYRSCDTDHYEWQLAVGSAFRSALSAGLRSLGVTFRRAGRDQFEIAGIPQSLIDAFSKRSLQIEAVTGRSDSSAAQKELAALASRRSKADVPTGLALEARWRREFDALDVDPWTAVTSPTISVTAGDELNPDHEFEAPEIAGNTPVARAASAHFRHEAILSRRVLLQHSLAEASLHGGNIESVYAEVAALESARKLCGLTQAPAQCWTTPTIAAAEAAMLRALVRENGSWFDAAAVMAVLASAPHLSEEQKSAVLHATSAAPISIVEAGAGTGKTTLAKAIVNSAARSGLRTVGLSPSWIAADELTKSTGIEAVAVAKWRHSVTTGYCRSPDEKSLILIDEGGMVGTSDFSYIMQVAKDVNSKVVVISDMRQLAPVPGATPLRAIADVLERQASLSQVRRQQIDWQRAASTIMARGDVEAGLRTYAAQGRIELVAGSELAQRRTVALWRELRETYGDDAIVITRRNRDAASINQQARQVLREEGRISTVEHQVSATDHSGKLITIPISVGDRIRFGENLPQFGVRNGTRACIECVSADCMGQPRLTLTLDSGNTIEAAWSELTNKNRQKPIAAPRVTHAIAGTVYAAQGKTVSAAVLHVQSATDAREVYVGLTRHRGDAYVVIESSRLEAACRARQADPRIAPSRHALIERLFAEARRYHEKANVVDHVDDRRRFVASGEIRLAERDPRLNIARAIEAASLRKAVGRELGGSVWTLMKTTTAEVAMRSFERVDRMLRQLITGLRSRVAARLRERREPDWEQTR